MKVKSSDKSIYYILGAYLLLVLVLFGLQSFSKKKKEVIIVPEVEQITELDGLQISFKEKHYKKLKEKRNKALADGILETSDNDYVPTIITFNGKDYKADLRLKGDWTDHLEGDKWSFRIKLKDDQTIFGMRKFSIHHPKTRGYVNEWLYHQANKAEDLMGLRYNFAEGFMHINLKDSDSIINKNLGIYAFEETFDKRTIESNRRKAGVILRISEQYFWKEVKQAWKIQKQTSFSPQAKRKPMFSGPGQEYVTTFGLKKILANESLNKQFMHAKNLLEAYRNLELPSSQVFDADKLALHTALNNLFGGYHGLAAINLRFYYNPTTSKLEPISYDGNSGQKLDKFHHYLYTNRNMDPVYKDALIKALEKISQPEYLEKLYIKTNKEALNYEAILKTEFKNAALIKREHYEHNQAILKKELIRLKNED